MTTLDFSAELDTAVGPLVPDEAQLAAVAFLAPYGGRTLDAYRHDLRNLFQWAADHGLPVLEATRANLEMYRSSMGGTRSGRLDDRPAAVHRVRVLSLRPHRPVDYVQPCPVRTPSHRPPTEQRGLDRGELGRFLFTAERFDHAHAALAVLLGLNGLRVSEACATNIEDMAFERGHRVLPIVGKGNKPALIPLVPRTARTVDLAIGERRDGPILQRHDGQRLDRRTAHRWVRSIGKRAELGPVHPHMLRTAFIMAALVVPRRRLAHRDEFELDVVGVSEHQCGVAVLIVDRGVFDAELVEA
jgi:integrase/recombinase XerD